MKGVPDIPFHKKLTQPPLMMKSFTVDQLLAVVAATVVLLGIAWFFGGFIAAIAVGATTFFGLKAWCGYMNTRLPPGYLTHRLNALFELRCFSPGIWPWSPVSAERPKGMKDTENKD